MVEIRTKSPIILNYLSEPTDYSQCISEMHKLHSLVVSCKIDSTVIVTRHNPVITSGLLNKKIDCHRFSVPFISTNRGGGITYHDPGQLVIYPVLRLTDFGISPGEYVKVLQKWASYTIRLFGFIPLTCADKIGVWISNDCSTVGKCELYEIFNQCSILNDFKQESINTDITANVKKVAFIGARIKSGVSLHGFSINLCTNLELFREFDPCGIANLNIGNLFPSDFQ